VATLDGLPLRAAALDAIRAEARLAGEGDGVRKARREGLRRILVRRQAERLGVAVAEADITTRQAAVTAQAGGEKALSAALAAVGLGRADLRAALTYALLEQALADEIYPQLVASRTEARAFYDDEAGALLARPGEVRLAEITVPTQKVARDVAARMAAGTPFAAAARRFSMDPRTRFDGGMLGWVLLASLPAEIRDGLRGVKAGEVSAPVHSLGRWHLYKVYARRAGSRPLFTEVAADLRAELTRRRRAAALGQWVARAFARAKVEMAP